MIGGHLVLRYLENLGHIVDRKFQRQSLKYVLLGNTITPYVSEQQGFVITYLWNPKSLVGLKIRIKSFNFQVPMFVDQLAQSVIVENFLKMN
jgi:uncharacterized protein (UPF0212 family)